ncbi:MAG: AIM24 family protein [Myxococcaceae bacterium]|nr:AIM24 family protein [Myxococcaceae bacterium]
MAEKPESVLDALVSMDPRLEEYCDSVSVEGVIAQSARLQLKRGQNLWVSRGGLLAYTEGIDWQLRIPGNASKALGRMLAGEGLALTYVTAQRKGAEVLLSANKPGKLATWDLSRGPIICTRGSFVAAVGEVDIDVSVARSAGAAFFGGAGLFLQRLSGRGVAFVHGSGDFIERQLAPGETLMVSTGHLAVFSASVGYDIRGVGGCRKMLFGGEGMFMTELTGPGWVMLQSLKETPTRTRQPQ